MKNNKLRVAVLMALSSRAYGGDVVLDGFTTGNLADDVSLTRVGTTFSINQNQGITSGTNLFHSFRSFNIDAGEIAAFNGNAAITNIVSRVTGGATSTINGTVRSNIAGANFWFVNPAGIIVGNGALFDVSGTLALGSANFIQFSNGQQWYALGNGGTAATALTVNPVDFGFLPSTPAGRVVWNRTTGNLTIAPQGDLILANADVSASGSLRLEGDAIRLTNSHIRTDLSITNADDIVLFARDSDIVLRQTRVSATGFDAIEAGNITLDARLAVSLFDSDIVASKVQPTVATGTPAGNITINAQSIAMLGGTLDVSLSGQRSDGRAGSILLGTNTTRATLGDVTIGRSLNSALPGASSFARLIASKSDGFGGGGEVRIIAGGLVQIVGNNPNISVAEVLADGIYSARADAVPSLDVRNIRGSGSALSQGDGGNVHIRAGNLVVQNALIMTEEGPTGGNTNPSTAGIDIVVTNRLEANAGSFLSLGPTSTSRPIDIQARDIELSNGSIISTAVGDDGSSANVTIRASDRLYANRDLDTGATIEGVNPVLITGQVSTGRANQGDIFLQASDAGADIRLHNTIIASSLGTGGSANVRPTSVTINGGTGLVELSATDILLQGGQPSGSAGSAFINGDRVVLENGTDISSQVGGDGYPGQILITATTSITSNASSASSPRVTLSTAELGEAGAGGAQIVLEAPTINLRNTDILSSSRADGGTGSGQDMGAVIVRLTAPLAVTLDGVNIDTQAFAGRAGGSITVGGGQTTTLTNTNITASSSTCPAGQSCGSGNFPTGAAGNVSIQGSNVTLSGGSVRSTTNTDGNAGAVSITGGAIALRQGARVETSSLPQNGSEARAGDVTVSGTSLITLDNAIVNSQSVSGGAAGNISIQGSGVLIANQSRVTADYNNPTSDFGPGSIVIRAIGTMTETAPQTTLNAPTAGVIRIVNSGVTANNVGGGDGAIRGNINIGAGQPTQDPNSTRTDAVVIAGSVVSTNVSAGGSGDDISIVGNRGVWIQRSATNGFQGYPGPQNFGFPDPRGSDRARSLITATTDTTASDAGSILIQGGNLGVSIENSNIDTSNKADGTVPGSLDPSNIAVVANVGRAFLNDSVINADTINVVAAGNITVDASTIDVRGGQLTASTSGSGDAGVVTLTASGVDAGTTAALQVRDGATLSSTAAASAPGGAPNSVGSARTVSLNAINGTVSVAGTLDSPTLGTRISTSADASAGAAGQIILLGSNISVSGSELTTTVASADPGAATVQLAATNAATVAGSRLDASTTGAARSGSVTITGSTVDVSGGELRASTTGSGAAGNVAVTAISADQGGVAALRIRDDAFLSSNALGGTSRANAGNVSLTAAAGTVSVAGTRTAPTTPGTQLTTSAGANAGTAGQVTLTGNAISVSGAELVTTTASTIPLATGQVAASVTLNSTSAVTVANSRLDASTTGAARSGDVLITGTSVDVSGGALRAATSGSGNAGSVSITARSADSANVAALRVRDGALLASNALGGVSRANAGDVSLTATLGTVSVTGTLNSSTLGTQITTSAGATAGAAGRVTLSGNNLSVSGAELVTTTASTVPLTTGQAPASVTLSAANSVAVSGSRLDASTTGAARSGDITVTGNTVDVSGGTLSASTSGTGNAGLIAITARNADSAGNIAALRIRDGAALSSSARILPSGGAPGTVGNAGNVSLTATAGTVNVAGTRNSATLGTRISTSADASAGAAGQVTIVGNNISVSGAELTTNVASAAPGAAAVTLNATNAATVSGSRLDASTTGAARSGDVIVTGNTVDVSGGELRASTSGSGNAGSVTVTARSADSANIAALRIRDGAQLASTAISGTSRANAGNVSLTATLGTVSVAGTRNGPTPATQVTTNAGAAAGAAGQVTLAGNNISVSGAELTTTTASTVPLSGTQLPATVTLDATNAVTVSASNLDASTSGAARGGDIDISGNAVLISDTSTLSATTSGAGAAGGIFVTSGAPATPQSVEGSQSQPPVLPGAGGLTVDGSTLSTSTSNTGAAGGITLNAQGQLLLSNAEVFSRSTLATAAAGAAGSIQMFGQSVSVLDGSDISATLAGGTIGVRNASGTRIGGTPLANISLNVTSATGQLLIEDSQITTDAVIADSGNILLNAGGSPLTLSGTLIQASAGATGQGGSIVVDNAGKTIMQRSLILAQADRGNGGAIDIDLIPGALFIRDSQTAINADSSAGNNGTVNISSPDTDLNSAIKAQDVEVATPPELGNNVCSATNASDRSTFVRENRGGVALSPDSYLTAMPAASASRTAARSSIDARDSFIASTTNKQQSLTGCP